jgi:hypothetical protein
MIRMRPRSHLRYRRASSHLDFRRHRQDEPAPELVDNEPDEPDPPDDALSWFWSLIEASSVEDITALWPDFEPRARELRQLGRVENVREVLTHLGLALDESELWSDWSLRAKRAAILKAIGAAGR